MRETSDLSLEQLEQHDLDGLIHDNTQIRAQSTFMNIHGEHAERATAFEIKLEPESGLKIDSQKVVEGLKKAWDGVDERIVEDGDEKRVYWQSWEPGSFMNWTTELIYKLEGKGRKQKEVLQSATVTANMPAEYQELLSRQETPELVKKAQGPRGIGRFAAKAALISKNNPSATTNLRRLQ